MDEAMAKAKVRSSPPYSASACNFIYLALQESPSPDPSHLFRNVYVKGLGVEVIYEKVDAFEQFSVREFLS